MQALAHSEAHQRDMDELAGGPFPGNLAWPPLMVVEWTEQHDPVRGAVLRRMHGRGLACMEQAGRLYQAAYEAWKARVEG
jgi:hypothetical protein